MVLQTNIYDNQIYFGLTFQGETTFILEPKGWDKISNHIPRDTSWFGFTSDFLEDKYGMLFTFIKDKPIWSAVELTGGGDLLKYIYETIGLGPNEDVFFEFGNMVGNTPERINQWRIVFDDYECDKTINGGVSVSIEKMPFQAKYNSRNTAPCTLNGYLNMDGELLNPISSWQLRLHSKTLPETSRCLTGVPQMTNDYSDGGGIAYNIMVQPDQSNLIINELTEVFTQPTGLINTGELSAPASTGALTTDTFTNGICQYTAATNGDLSIKYSGSLLIWSYQNLEPLGIIGGVGVPDKAPCWRATPRVVIQRIVGGVLSIVDTILGTPFDLERTSPGYTYPMTLPIGLFPAVVNSSNRNFSSNIPYSWSEDTAFANIPVEANDNIYVQLYFQVFGEANYLAEEGFFINVQSYFNDITYFQLTTTPASTADGYRIFDVITQFLENITGYPNRLKSSFFSPGGFGYKYLLTNGYAIRNFGGQAYQFKQALESLLKSLQSIFAIGKGFQTIDGVEYMVIEHMSHFFQNGVIGTYTNVLEWKDVHASKFIYNKAELGYKKYEGLNIIQQDEFCTDGSYLLQFIKYNSNTLNSKSDLIAAGYLIEEQRRNQFLANPGQTLTNDNDIFIIATSEPCIFHSLSVVFTHVGVNLAVFNLIILGLLPGDTFVTNSGTNAGTVFTVVSSAAGSPTTLADIYEITPAPLTEGLTTDVTITPPSPNQIFTERNQPFEICSNVIDPTTIYNGRLSMKHILYNWRALLGVGLYFLDPESQDYTVSQIVTTLVKMNSLFTSKFLATEPNKGNAGTLTLIEIAQEWVRNYLASGTSIFTPIGGQCKIKIGWNDMNVIRQAICGELGDYRDFGGLVLQDDFGENWFCHITDIQYNLVSQIATLQVQKVYPVI